MRHTCHAVGCGKAVPPRLLMCFPHWKLVPRHVQGLVWRFYRRGQEVDKRPSAAYLCVQALAVLSVAMEEGRPEYETLRARARALLAEQPDVQDAIASEAFP